METFISKAIRRALVLAPTLALALPAGAVAADVVPPENSAATQYTEAIPTGGGQKGTGGSGGGATPAAVLGASKAKKLESHGRAGREVAAVVAATAPSSPLPESSGAPTSGPATQNEGGGGSRAKAKPDNGSARQGQPGGGAASGQTAPTQIEIPAGSSGLGEVLAQATGSSASGQLGALLPLTILAALIWALAFLWRQRPRPA